MSIKLNRCAIAAALAGLFLSGAANAVAILDSGSEPSLNELFQDWIVTGDPLDVNGPEQVTSSSWSIGSSTLSAIGLVIEYAGNAALNTFGIYDLSDPTNRLELFAGANSAGNHSVLQYLGGNQFASVNLATFTSNTATFSSSSFGFYLGAVGNTFYSDASLNGGNNQMVAFQGDNERTTNFFGVGSATWLSNEWILAWEDLAYGNSDKDFNDFVVSVESVNPDPTPVPEPTTLALLGSGLLASTIIKRRRNKKNAETAA